MEFIKALEQPAMFQFDIAMVCLLLGVGLFIKDKTIRLTLWVAGLLYLFFTILWHMPWEIYV